MTTGWAAEDCADPIVIPFVLTIADPRRPARDGMSRLEPSTTLPANGWAAKRIAAHDGAFSFLRWLGISAAQAQELPSEEEEEISRRSTPGRSLTAAEEFRLELYNAATRRLIHLDPGNPELRGIATRDYVPDEPALARREAAVEQAERQASSATAGDDGAEFLFGYGAPGIIQSKALRIAQAVEHSLAEAANAKTPEELLQSLATSAVRYSEGPTAQTFGSDAYFILQRSLQALAVRGSPLAAEVSYLNGNLVVTGTPSSIRIDILVGKPGAPEAV